MEDLLNEVETTHLDDDYFYEKWKQQQSRN